MALARIAWWIAGLCVAAMACGGASRRGEVWGDHGSAGWTYDVRVDDSLESAVVRTCFDGAPHGWLAPADPEGLTLVTRASVVHGTSARPVRVTEQGIALDGLDEGDCVVTAVNLEAHGPGWHGMLRREGVRVASPQAWLWGPRPRREDARIELTLHLPEGVRASVPWEPLGRGRYRLDPTALRWRSFAAFGDFTIERIELPGGVLEVALLGRTAMTATPAGVRRWLEGSARAAASLHGELPVRRIQVLLVPTDGGGREPVLFGATARGGGSGVILFPNAEADDDMLLTDWVASHELSHFALPVVPDADAWASEGFITYYTEVLRARAGLRTPEEAWAALARGCLRGHPIDADDASPAEGGRALWHPVVPDDQSLAEVSANMRENHAFQRVYWGGASVALAADVEIRSATRGRASLDSALREIARRPQVPGRALPADELLRGVSEVNGGAVLERVADAALGRATLPSLDELFQRLGVRRVPGGGVELDDSAPDAWIREAITRPAGALPRARVPDSAPLCGNCSRF